MKKTLGLALVGGLMAVGLGQSQAQTTNGTSFSLQTLNISLSGFAGSGDSNASPIKIDTKRVISSLVGSNSTKAKLQFGFNTTDSSGPFFFVTSGTSKNITAVDVTPFFGVGTLAGPLSKGKTSYAIDSFIFGGTGDTNVVAPPLSFGVQGYTTAQTSGSFNSQVNGSGTDENGNLTVLKGVISATPAKTFSITIVNGGGGGGGGTNTTASASP